MTEKELRDSIKRLCIKHVTVENGNHIHWGYFHEDLAKLIHQTNKEYAEGLIGEDEPCGSYNQEGEANFRHKDGRNRLRSELRAKNSGKLEDEG